MTALLLLKLLTFAVSIALAATILGRDPGLRINRLMALVVACTAWWSLCEVLWNLQSDPEVALWWVRISSLGWLLVGPAFFHIFVELAGSQHSRLHWATPVVYAASLGCFGLYLGTNWCVTGMLRTEWGWGYEFGPVFVLPYLVAAVPPTLVLASWRTVYPSHGSRGERTMSLFALGGTTAAVLVASTTDALLPLMGIRPPPLGSSAITLMSVSVAWSIRRYGYSLLSAGAFAEEILETLRDGVVLLYPDGRVRAVNGALARWVGTSPEGLRGRPLGDLLLRLPAAGGELSRAYETELRAANGASIPVWVSAPLFSRARGLVAGAALVVRDQREVVELRRNLVISARRAAVGDLSAAIAASIARPVFAVRDSLGELRREWEQLGDDIEKRGFTEPLGEVLAEGGELLAECQDGVTRISGLARDVGGFTTPISAEREPTAPRELVESAVRMTSPRVGPGVDIVCDLPDVPRVLCARREIEQVLVNLLANALQAIGQSGHVRVSCETEGDRVRIHVDDDGPGIPPDLRDRIFDPFFTTKPVGEGTGLGLAISYHIVKSHGGEIQVFSQPGQGARFTVDLPVSR